MTKTASAKINKKDPFVIFIKKFLNDSYSLSFVNFNDFKVFVDSTDCNYQFGCKGSDQKLVFHIPLSLMQGTFVPDEYKIEQSSESGCFRYFKFVNLTVGDSVLNNL